MEWKIVEIKKDRVLHIRMTKAEKEHLEKAVETYKYRDMNKKEIWSKSNSEIIREWLMERAEKEYKK